MVSKSSFEAYSFANSLEFVISSRWDDIFLKSGVFINVSSHGSSSSASPELSLFISSSSWSIVLFIRDLSFFR